jgi:hypothetical protein
VPVLRISHTGSHLGTSFQHDGPLLTDKRPFSFSLTPQDGEDIRWYLEDSFGHLTDARDWAQSALRDFQTRENAEQEVVNTLKLLEEIESDLRATSPPSSTHPRPPR